MKRTEDQCAHPSSCPQPVQRASTPPIYPTAAYLCNSPDEAAALMAGEIEGYIYQRDGHPNGDQCAEMLRELHAADMALVTSSGMSALSLALLSLVRAGGHVVISNQLYGRSSRLFATEARRLGIDVTEVDTSDLQRVHEACRKGTTLLVAETVTNPLLRVTDVRGLSAIAREIGATLLIDNTFATPIVCRPIELGADLVMESVTKMINGHGDVSLGALCGGAAHRQRMQDVCCTWGLTAGPFACWLATRGMATLHVRMQRASQNALVVARSLESHPQIQVVHYPGLPSHPDHALAKSQFVVQTDANLQGSETDSTVEASAGAECWYGSMVTFTLAGGRAAANALISSLASKIPFCPSLGEVATTLSHPASTSHRAMTPQQRDQLGIQEGTIRLSLGIGSAAEVLEALEGALGGLDESFQIGV